MNATFLLAGKRTTLSWYDQCNLGSEKKTDDSQAVIISPSDCWLVLSASAFTRDVGSVVTLTQYYFMASKS